MPLLEVSGLSVEFPTGDGRVRAVDGVDFVVHEGESVGIVGETGSGKSVTALGLLGLLDQPGEVTAGTALFEGRDLLTLSERELLDVRGKRIGMIFQEPSTSLNPTATIGAQLAEALETERYDAWRDGTSRGLARSVRSRGRRGRQYRAEKREEAIDVLRQVRLPAPDALRQRYPFMLSGGMLQRAMIGVALASRPSLLIADEPTTALDVTIQAQIVEILRERKQSQHLALLLITHDLGLVAELCDRVVVMYAGRVVETAPVAELFESPAHPYTRGLIASMPSIDRGRAELRAMDGSVPRVIRESASSCYFAARCPLATETCRTRRPVVAEVSARHHAACHVYTEPTMTTAAGRVASLWREPNAGSGLRHETLLGVASERSTPEASEPMLEVLDLYKHFPVRGSGRLGSKTSVRAVDGVSLSLRRGETLALVGESGCGKTTLAEVLLQLQPASAGEVRISGKSVRGQQPPEIRRLRREIQVVFQNPRSSLSPRMRIRDILLEPLIAQFGSKQRIRRAGTDPREHTNELLAMVGLDPSVAAHYPHALSGGQAQRVAIARALALRPDIIVLDEPTSALDVSVQAQILNLLRRLQRELELTFLFISHDLRVVHHVSDRIAVMYLGALVETGDTATVFEAPAHPYTQALLSSIPRDRPDAGRERILLPGDVPSATNIPTGCRFRTRCPLAADVCKSVEPEARVLPSGQVVACHFAGTSATKGAIAKSKRGERVFEQAPRDPAAAVVPPAASS